MSLFETERHIQLNKSFQHIKYVYGILTQDLVHITTNVLEQVTVFSVHIIVRSLYSKTIF